MDLTASDRAILERAIDITIASSRLVADFMDASEALDDQALRDLRELRAKIAVRTPERVAAQDDPRGEADR